MIYIEFSNSADGGRNLRPLRAWSRDGQEVDLDIGMYFRIPQTSVLPVYRRHRDGWRAVLQDVAVNAIRDTATEFDTIAFFEARQAIDERIKELIDERVDAQLPGVTVAQLHMLEIRVPTRFEEAVREKVIRNVERVALTFRRNSTLERQKIREIDAVAARRVAEINSNTTKRATILRAGAAARAQLDFANNRANILRTVAARLGFAHEGGVPVPLGSEPSAAMNVSMPETLQFLYSEVTRGQRTAFSVSNGQVDSATSSAPKHLVVNFPEVVIRSSS